MNVFLLDLCDCVVVIRRKVKINRDADLKASFDYTCEFLSVPMLSTEQVEIKVKHCGKLCGSE